jgi:dCMP deaminase
MISRKDEQYMELCSSISKIFSTCAKRKYAAILVDEYGHIVGVGYNGGPSGVTHCDQGGCPRLTEGSENGSIYDNCIAIHAEANALLHSDYSSRAKKMYINGPPCFSCAKLIANSTVDTVYCLSDQSYKEWPKVKKFLSECSVEVLEANHASS